MPSTGQSSGIAYDSHGQGLANLEGDLVSMMLNSQRIAKSFCHSASQLYGPCQMEPQKDSTDRVSMPEKPSAPYASCTKGHRKKRWEQSSLFLEYRAQVVDFSGLHLLRLCHVGRWLRRRSHPKFFSLRGSFLFQMI